MHQNSAATPFIQLTEESVASAFSYLRAVQADDAQAATELVAAEPRMPTLLAAVAKNIVRERTSLPGPDDYEPTWDTFDLVALGNVFLNALHTWQQAGPDAAQGIARTLLEFITVILSEEQDDVANYLNVFEHVAKAELRLNARAVSAARSQQGPSMPRCCW
ncbi:hypothetical protein ACTVZO_41685 [Streptomyces sp. IBSNAI002]|uniref:hypothetical protein n=1 Tax=Streptomyces sp. IBSNAI002 TaxID=3457500 RepID=UPI003FD3CB22